MAEKLYASRCSIHGHSGCEVCRSIEHSWNDRKRRSKERREQADDEVREQLNDNAQPDG